MTELILSANDFKALSSDTRVQIIKLLAGRNYNLTELSGKLKLSAPSIKQHVDVLLDNGLIVQLDEKHKWKYYSLSRKGRKLVEPYNTQVLIVLSTVLVGILGIAFIASALFGFQSMNALSGASVSDTGLKDFGVPKAATSGEAVSKAPETASQNTQQPEVQKEASNNQASGNYYLSLLVLGVLLLFFSALIYNGKISWFR